MLDLVWIAWFADGFPIEQFDGAGQTKEHAFREIQEKAAKVPLVSFELVNLRSHIRYIADIIRGHVIITPKNLIGAEPENEVSGDSSNKYRLIHFRRVTHEFQQGKPNEGSSNPSNIDYFLGYQWTDSDGKNHKRLMQITKDDEVFIV